MITNGIDAIIFDCDGTLVDSEVLGNEVLVEYVAELGLEMPVEEAVELFTGGKMAEAVAELERRHNRPMPHDFVPMLRSRMAEAFHDRLQPIDGAHDLLQSLSIPYCLASNGPLEKIGLTLSITRLDRFFTRDRIFSAYELSAWKPDPGLFLHAASALGVTPDRCAVVEDSSSGIKAGVAAGMRVFALNQPEATTRFGAGVKNISSLAELGLLFSD